MRNKAVSLSLLLFLAVVTIPNISFSQGTRDNANAVVVSTNYYNSIVKILLYDSAYAKKHPENAYLGRGSGFIVRSDGYIFTNRHVIWMCAGYARYQTYNADTKSLDNNIDVYKPTLLTDPAVKQINYVGRASAIVQVYDDAMGSSYKLYYAKVVAIDTANFDGAIIKIVSDLNGNPVDVKFHPVPIGNSDSTFQGQDLCLYGFPAQYNGTYEQMLKDGSTLISGKHSGFDFVINSQYGFIKTDANINNGNSGGPVFGKGNQVIGLATAAFDEDKVGLIGGINAMYYLATLVPDLRDSLVAKGLTPPERVPLFSTAYLYKPKVLPTGKKLSKVNNSATKAGIANNPVLIDIIPKLSTGSNGHYGTYQIQQSQANGLSSTGGTWYVAQNYDFGLNLRVSMPGLIKIKNNLIGAFLNFSGSLTSENWSTVFPSLYYSYNASNYYAYLNPTAYFYGTGSAGLSYSYLFNPSTSLGLYFSYGLTIDALGGLGNITYSNPDNGSQEVVNIKYQGNPFTNEAIGLLFRLKHLVLGAEYRISSSENVSFKAVDGNNTTINGNPTGVFTETNSISLFVGVAIRPKKKQQ